MKKYFPILILAIFILSGLAEIGNSEVNIKKNIIKETINFSNPLIEECDRYSIINLKEATSSLMKIGGPVLPVFTKKYVLPFGSKIYSIEIISSEIYEINLNKEIEHASKPEILDYKTKESQESGEIKINDIYKSNQLYPLESFNYSIRTGLLENKHVTYLTLQLYPIKLSPVQNRIFFSKYFDIIVIYEDLSEPLKIEDKYDMVIITPNNFSVELEPLVKHKNSHGIDTFIKPVEEIFASYNGKDNIEDIKLFIKDAIENYNISYVLLCGSIYKIPIRISNVILWDWKAYPPTDLYYSDIYDSEGNFSSWDTNNNNLFGETNQDVFDLCPDVHIGRLACDRIGEVKIVINKIINYEKKTQRENWFTNMIFLGGDTHFLGNYEGEEHNSLVMEIMSNFNPITIWTSIGNFNKKTISEAINSGAGFLDYSGHGFENGIGTYLPDSDKLQTYHTRNIKYLRNGYKLPIIFLSACLTAKLDFVLKDLLDYQEYEILKLLKIIPGFVENYKLPSFAWSLVNYKDGGSIASIGATRIAYEKENFGAIKLSEEFFRSYENSITLGQMLTKAQNSYISEIPNDELTVEEFILLGDPSLKVGGYY